MAFLLTPAAIAEADYSLAQTPVLGGEMEVWLTTKPARLLGIAFLTATDTIQYRYKAIPSTGTGNPGPIVAVALETGVSQSAVATVTYAGLTASFDPVAWSPIQGFDFPVGRGAEFGAGVYAAPLASDVPTVAGGMLSGSKFAIIELPKLTDFVLAGCTTDRRIKIPARGTKNIACGMSEAEWTTPGRQKVGELEISGHNQGIDSGLHRFMGRNVQAMLVAVREGRVITQRTFCLDVTLEADEQMPEGEGEASVTLRGQFAKMCVLPAP